MPVGSANPFPSLLVVEQGSTPANPASGNQKLFVKTSDHLLYFVNSSGTVTAVGGGMSNPMTTKGDIIIGDTGGTPTRLAAGATSGMVLTSAGSAAFETFSLPPGYEFANDSKTTPVTVTGTAEGAETTLITGSSVAYDGSTKVRIDLFCCRVDIGPSAAGRGAIIMLYRDSTVLGRYGLILPTFVSSETHSQPLFLSFFETPSNASHSYTAKCWKSNTSDAVTFSFGAGGTGTEIPGFLRVTKV